MDSSVNPEMLDRMARAAGLGEASIVLAGLDDGRETGLRADRPIYPASMIKVPIAAALESRRAAGALRLEDLVAVDPADMTTNDAPSPFVSGERFALGMLGAAMISASDNVATNVLIGALGRESITEDLRSEGLELTAVRRKLSGSAPLIDDPAATGRNAHPAGDAARLFAAIAGAAARGPSWIYDALLAQVWNGKLAAGWRPGDVFAHKTGDTDDVSHDGGILTLPGGKRYVVVVYTELPSNAETDERLRAFASALRPHLGD